MTTRFSFLIENESCRPKIGSEHGLAVLVEKEGHRILFDTGQSDLLLANAREMSIDLSSIDRIVLSHGHYDHGGGLEALSHIVEPEIIVAHQAALESRYSVVPGSLARQIGITMPENFFDRLQIISKMTELVPGLFFLGVIPRQTSFEDTGGSFFLDPQGKKPDLLPDDSGLLVLTDSGPVLLVGCAHSGIVNMLQYVAQMLSINEFTAVLGGMHLLNAKTERLQKTVDAFRSFQVKQIGPVHCTGERGVCALTSAFQDRIVSCPAGTVLEF
ncbi:MAG: MBL fold metallo-hydrolase [Thermodesulfobacteriota bacterium]|nr:MBL fold metallo-hydrolase [Thermodesulfobacteriota bacterium]